MEIWYRTDRFNRASENKLTAGVEFPEESPWFDGHFPQEPILPGIAQVAVVHDLLCRALGKLPVREIGRVRFKRKISPLDKLAVTVTRDEDAGGMHSFRMTCEGELVCSGFLKTGIGKESE